MHSCFSELLNGLSKIILPSSKRGLINNLYMGIRDVLGNTCLNLPINLVNLFSATKINLEWSLRTILI